MLKRSIVILMAVVLVLGLVACSSQNTEEDIATEKVEVVTLKGAIAIDPSHPYYLGMEKFAEIVSEKTNGNILVEIYHSGQLGSERDVIEGLSMGSIDLTVVSSAPVSSFVPNIAVFDLPYLFPTREQAYKVMDGPIGTQFFEELTEFDIVGLGWFENGYREITNSKRPIVTPEDLKGIKIRVMESPVPIATFNEAGANATPMAWGEVFTALQQGTIDAQENPLPVIYSQKLYEVQKYLSLTDHFYAPALFLMSDVAFEKLNEEQQKIVMDAAKEATTYQRQVSKEQAESFVEKCIENGMEVNEVDKSLFVEAMAPVYDLFEDEFGRDLIDAIINTK